MDGDRGRVRWLCFVENFVVGGRGNGVFGALEGFLVGLIGFVLFAGTGGAGKKRVSSGFLEGSWQSECGSGVAESVGQEDAKKPT
jgi:hypothetical protein